MSLISVDSLFYAYEKEFVLRDVSFQISPCEAVAIIGPNGGGKTTLLQLLMGFYAPTKGRVSVAGTPARESRCRMGYVPQRLPFDSQFPISTLEVVLMGALSSLSFWGRYPSHVKDRAFELLEEVGLKNKQDQAFGSLSGGQMQRALIARALMIDPDILFLDEPTASIDPYSEKNLLELLHEKGRGKTMIIVTHELNSVIKNVKKVLCVQGSVTLLTPEEVCEHFVQGLYHPPLLGKESS